MGVWWGSDPEVVLRYEACFPKVQITCEYLVPFIFRCMNSRMTEYVYTVNYVVFFEFTRQRFLRCQTRACIDWERFLWILHHLAFYFELAILFFSVSGSAKLTGLFFMDHFLFSFRAQAVQIMVESIHTKVEINNRIYSCFQRKMSHCQTFFSMCTQNHLHAFAQIFDTIYKVKNLFSYPAISSHQS